MKIEKIEIEKGIIIRKPYAEDLEYERPLGLPIFDEFTHHPSAILEIKKRVKTQPAIYSELEKIIIALQLYKVGSVTKTKVYWEPKSFLQFGGSSSPIRSWSVAYRYCLDEDDKNKLPQFMKEVKDKLPVDEKTGRPISSNLLGIAILRYQDSLLKPEAVENKIAYTVMGLEALYLKAEEREELSHRLAQRVAKIQSIFGEKPIKVYNILKEAYDIRSRFVHGSIFQEKEPQKVKKILDDTLEYLRKSILTFVQLSKEKDELLSLVDNALLEKQADDKLSKLIKESVATLGS